MDKSAGGRHKDEQDERGGNGDQVWTLCRYSEAASVSSVSGRGLSCEFITATREKTTHSETSVADDTSLLVSHMNKMQSEWSREEGGGGILVLIRDCPRV